MKYILLALLCLQGLLGCRESKKEPDLTLALVGNYEGAYTYQQWYGSWGPMHPAEFKSCQPRLNKVDNNTVGVEIPLLGRPLVVEADVSLENQVYHLVVQPAQWTDRTAAGISEYDQPGYHGTFDPVSKLLKLNLLETMQGKEYLVQVASTRQ